MGAAAHPDGGIVLTITQTITLPFVGERTAGGIWGVVHRKHIGVLRGFRKFFVIVDIACKHMYGGGFFFITNTHAHTHTHAAVTTSIPKTNAISKTNTHARSGRARWMHWPVECWSQALARRWPWASASCECRRGGSAFGNGWATIGRTVPAAPQTGVLAISPRCPDLLHAATLTTLPSPPARHHPHHVTMTSCMPSPSTTLSSPPAHRHRPPRYHHHLHAVTLHHVTMTTYMPSLSPRCHHHDLLHVATLTTIAITFCMPPRSPNYTSCIFTVWGDHESYNS